jgi:hypothetical protein
MKQQPLATAAEQNMQREQYRKPTRQDMFLTAIEYVVAEEGAGGRFGKQEEASPSGRGQWK